MKELKILKEIEEVENRIDLKEALTVLQKIKSGQTDFISLEEAKKELDI